ncbi:MAG: ugpQ [Gammaproteobacteria bacterium]|nr:ugpQ [Gammaproteobacteria bacterium]
MTLPLLFPKTTIIGHRGVASLAPENTLAGFQRAAQLGCRWVEFDVNITSDRVPVLLHDTSLLRTTGHALEIEKVSLAQLQSCEAGAWFSPDYRGEKIPTLQETLTILEHYKLSANLEIKPTKGRELETVRAIIDCLNDHGKSLNSLVLSSFSEVVNEELVRLSLPYLHAWLTAVWHEDWQDKVKAYQCVGVHIAQHHLTEPRIHAFQEAGLYVLAYTVNDVKRARELIDWGVNGVFTDVPQALLPLI